MWSTSCSSTTGAPTASRPSLSGHEFHRVESPNRYGPPPFYALHAWVWEHNPDGITANWNPRVDC